MLWAEPRTAGFQGSWALKKKKTEYCQTFGWNGPCMIHVEPSARGHHFKMDNTQLNCEFERNPTCLSWCVSYHFSLDICLFPARNSEDIMIFKRRCSTFGGAEQQSSVCPPSAQWLKQTCCGAQDEPYALSAQWFLNAEYGHPSLQLCCNEKPRLGIYTALSSTAMIGQGLLNS